MSAVTTISAVADPAPEEAPPPVRREASLVPCCDDAGRARTLVSWTAACSAVAIEPRDELGA